MVTFLIRNRGQKTSVLEALGLVRRAKKRPASAADVTTDSRRIPTPYKKVRPEHDRSVRSSKVHKKNATAVFLDADLKCRNAFSNQGSSSSPLENWMSPAKRAPTTIDTFNQTASRELPPATALTYRSFDNVLQEVLDEVGSQGIVYPSRPQFLQALKHSAVTKDKELEAFDIVDSKLKDVFKRMVAIQSSINEELDKKDAFLASCNLVRPGIGAAIRKRREENYMELNRGTSGRLRPNPRRRRFSDAVSPHNAAKPAQKGARQPEEMTRAAAAKKLARAKSQQIGNKPEPKRGRPKKSPCQFSEETKTTVVHTAITTRPRRAADNRQHIEWKYCYENRTEKKPSAEISQKKRQTTANADLESHRLESPGEHQESDDFTEDKPDSNSPTSPLHETAQPVSERKMADRIDDATLDRLSQLGAAMAHIQPKKRSESIQFQRKRPANSTLGGESRRISRAESVSPSRARSSSSDSSNAFSGAAEY